jgi:serine phosphatase RsbU (regulator of sigma subunit)
MAVSAYRNGRRRGGDLVEIYRSMDAGIVEEFGAEAFATAQLATLDLCTGRVCWLNAGHPQPMVIRRGHGIDLASETWLPVGLEGPDATLTETSLEPGDIVLFFTDGITEARSLNGREFGRERLADFVVRAAASGQSPAETVRLLSLAVLAYQDEVLQDDATLLLLAWDGPPPG